MLMGCWRVRWGEDAFCFLSVIEGPGWVVSLLGDFSVWEGTTFFGLGFGCFGWVAGFRVDSLLFPFKEEGMSGGSSFLLVGTTKRKSLVFSDPGSPAGMIFLDQD
jgi:hypothetical protein